MVVSCTSDEIFSKNCVADKLDKKVLKNRFPEGKVNVLTRNYPLKPDILKKRYKLKDGGNEYLIACTLHNGETSVLRCKLY